MSILELLILPNVSIIVDVDGIKYKVTNEHGKLGCVIDIEEITE